MTLKTRLTHAALSAIHDMVWWMGALLSGMLIAAWLTTPTSQAGTVHEVGAAVPGTPTVLGVDSTSSCTAALATGWYRIVPVASTVSIAYCCRSGTSCTATTTGSNPFVDGSYYLEAVTNADANDVICCVSASGTDAISLFITPLTY